jgi:tetratricopeptide (TPR) repeat protein
LAEGRGKAEAEEALDGLLRIGDVEAAAEAEIIIGDLLWNEARGKEAWQRFERARTLVEDLPPSRSTTLVLAHVARIMMLAGRFAESIELSERVLAAADLLDADDLRSHARNNIGTAKASAGDRTGLADLEESIALGERARSPWDVLRGYINLATCVEWLGDLKRAWDLHARGLEIAEATGSGPPVRWLLGEQAIDLYHAGRWAESLQRADALIDEVEAGSSYYLEGLIRSTRAWIRLSKGDSAGAIADSTRGLETARGSGDPQTLFPSLAEHARLLHVAGRDAEAAAAIDELLGAAAGDKAVLLRSTWLLPAAVVLDALGRGSEVAAVAGVGAAPSAWLDAATRWAAGDIVGAANVLDEMGAISEAALARLTAGERFLEAGQAVEARPQLESALIFYREVEATAFAGRAEGMLQRTA